jgi:hypothetical protein
MPVLHSYRSKEGSYILAGVNGKIVTYRLSVEGTEKLTSDGLTDGSKLSWPVLLELVRAGEAFTGTAGEQDEDLSGWTQLGLLFNIQEDEPSSNDPVPLCTCGSTEGLHVVELIDTNNAALFCSTCRTSSRNRIGASVPIYLINKPSTLDHLLERSSLTPDDSVMAYHKLLNANFSAKWNRRVLPRGKTLQAGLFAEPENEQQSLL